MREIKFRGRRVDNGEWVYGWYYEYNRKSIISSEYYSDDANTYINDEVITETVCRFTGVEDKSGVDIYEGDILIAANGTKGSIHFGEWEINVGDEVDNIVMGIGFYWLGGEPFSMPVNGKSYEVIGNIHDNPNLLT